MGSRQTGSSVVYLICGPLYCMHTKEESRRLFYTYRIVFFFYVLIARTEVHMCTCTYQIWSQNYLTSLQHCIALIHLEKKYFTLNRWRLAQVART
jgi:hypothetical protein